MTLYELEWAFTAWHDGHPDIERRLIDAVAQRWFLLGAAHDDGRPVRFAGGVLVPLGAPSGARRALWRDETELLSEAVPMPAWATRVPCWTPLLATRRPASA
ncbi:MAG TPA: hypothetical protein VMX54_00160 [Vicinamibacteria bacterium]|nr:hypothetical protein [Vicinamibacteria bacterium]